MSLSGRDCCHAKAFSWSRACSAAFMCLCDHSTPQLSSCLHVVQRCLLLCPDVLINRSLYKLVSYDVTLYSIVTDMCMRIMWGKTQYFPAWAGCVPRQIQVHLAMDFHRQILCLLLAYIFNKYQIGENMYFRLLEWGAEAIIHSKESLVR